MKEEVQKLEDMIDKLKEFMDYVTKKYKTYNRKEVVFCGMIVKKTIDILSTAEYSLKNYIITVQISLIRLLCDNCLAIESANQLTLDKLMDLIKDNQRANNVMIDEEQNMSDGYLKRLVANKYKGFDKLYKFACDGVHFSKQAIAGAFIEDSNGNIRPNFEVGNKEMKDTLISNNQSMIVLCNIIIDMMMKLCKFM